MVGFGDFGAALVTDPGEPPGQPLLLIPNEDPATVLM